MLRMNHRVADKVYNPQSGFSLTELAIVLGVVGIIIGSIWAVAGAVRKDVQREQFVELLSSTVKNLRGANIGAGSFDNTLVTSIMPKLTTMKVFPGDSIRNASGTLVVDSSFGQFVNPLANASPYNSFYICGWKATGSSNCEFTGGGTAGVPLFAVEALMPSGETCTKTLMQTSSPATLPGLVEVAINGYKVVNNGNGLPITVALAKAQCVPKDSAASDAVVVDYVFRLTPQL